MKKRVAIILFGSLLALSLCACGGDDTASTTQGETADTTTTEETQEPADTSSATVGDYEVSIGDAFVAPDMDGNPALIVSFEWTNNSEETVGSMVALHAQAFQDGVQLETAIMNSTEGYDPDASWLDIQPGATQTFQQAYTMTSETSPVEITVEEFLGDGTQATKTFDPATLA